MVRVPKEANASEGALNVDDGVRIVCLDMDSVNFINFQVREKVVGLS